MTRLELFYPHVFAQKRRHIQVLTFHDCRLAFFKTTASERLELQDFLLRCGSLIALWRFPLQLLAQSTVSFSAE